MSCLSDSSHNSRLRTLTGAWLVRLAILIASAGAAHAQSESAGDPSASLLRVFLDCNRCDSVYQRENVTFVDYVRDRTVADVHVLVTVESTGGGGQFWTVNFIGLDRFLGLDRTLTFSMPQSSTSDDRRTEFARVFRLGIVGYAADTPVASELDVLHDDGEDDGEQASPDDDPWNFWVFRINGNANLNGQQTRNTKNLSMSASASRTTDRWKMIVSVNRSINTTTFEIDDEDGEESIESRRTSWNLSGQIVKSLGDKWAIGSRMRMRHSSFSNLHIAASVAPGVQFDFFPYSESSRRSLTVAYSIGATNLDYVEETVYGRLSEVVPHHAIDVSLGLRQPWGSIGSSVDFSQHLNRLDRRRVSVFGDASVRLFTGFSLNFFGGYDKIADQIALPKGDATTEEVLLNLQQLQTDYSYRFFAGVSYSFGSIYNSVVNPRFNGVSDLSF